MGWTPCPRHWPSATTPRDASVHTCLYCSLEGGTPCPRHWPTAGCSSTRARLPMHPVCPDAAVSFASQNVLTCLRCCGLLVMPASTCIHHAYGAREKLIDRLHWCRCRACFTYPVEMSKPVRPLCSESNSLLGLEGPDLCQLQTPQQQQPTPQHAS